MCNLIVLLCKYKEDPCITEARKDQNIATLIPATHVYAAYTQVYLQYFYIIFATLVIYDVVSYVRSTYSYSYIASINKNYMYGDSLKSEWMQVHEPS